MGAFTSLRWKKPTPPASINRMLRSANARDFLVEFDGLALGGIIGGRGTPDRFFLQTVDGFENGLTLLRCGHDVRLS